MTTSFLGGAALAILLTTTTSSAATAQAASEGATVFAQRCAGCHEAQGTGAPSREALATRTQPAIVASLTTGVMKPMAAGLTAAQIAAVAAHLAPQKAAAGPRKTQVARR